VWDGVANVIRAQSEHFKYLSIYNNIQCHLNHERMLASLIQAAKGRPNEKIYYKTYDGREIYTSAYDSLKNLIRLPTKGFSFETI